MSDMEEPGQAGSGIGRRDFVKKSAIVGGMVWAAPAISTLGSRAFAQEGTEFTGEECENFTNFKIEQVDDVWQFVDCPGEGTEGSCIPEGWDFNGACIAAGGTQTGTGVKSGGVELIIDGDTYILKVEDGCHILLGGAKGGGGSASDEDTCVTFGPNGTAQTWDVEVKQGELSNIVGYICCP